MSNLVETEVKLYVPDLDSVIIRLNAAGAVMTKARVYEHNIRYEDTNETLTGRGIVLRLRQDAKVRLTYKEPQTQQIEGVLTRFEAEVTVDQFDMMDLILKRLGYHPHVVYEKYRTTYEFGGAEIVLDEMPYGNFIEVEGPAEEIEAALQVLNLEREPRILTGYMVLFGLVKAALNLDVQDLTFANFEGVVVPPEIFHQNAQGDRQNR